MMKPVGILKHAVVFVTIGVILSGCTPEKETSKKALRLMYYSCEELNPLWEKTVRDFENDHPGMRVKREMLVSQVQLQTQMAGNSSPDVVYIASKSLADFGTRGMLLDLRPFIARDKYDVDDILDLAFKEGSVSSGAIYGIPVTGAPVVMWYNKDLFDQAGLKYPEDWTWQNFLDAARKLTLDSNGDGIRDQVGTVRTGAYWADALPWIWAAGGDLFSKEPIRCIVNSPEAVKAMQFLVDLELKYKVTTKGAVWGDKNAEELFMTGKIGMQIYLPMAFNKFSKARNLNWDIALIPRGEKGRFPRYTGECFCIWSGSRYKEESWDLVKRLTSKEAAVSIAKSNWMPARKSVLNSPDFLRKDTLYREEILLTSLKYARAVPSVPGLGGQEGKLLSIWQRNMDLCFLERQTVSAALRRIEEEANAELSGQDSRNRKQDRK